MSLLYLMYNNYDNNEVTLTELAAKGVLIKKKKNLIIFSHPIILLDVKTCLLLSNV